MTRTRPFNAVKLQWLALLSQDKTLSSTAIVIAVYIVTVHYNQDKGKAWPSYATIAKATGKNVKTVQRAINELDGTWFNVKRGNGIGHSTEFTPNEASIQTATALRHKRDNIVPLRPLKGGRKRPQRGAKLSFNGGQNCPPNQETESRNEKSTRPRMVRPGNLARLFIEFESNQSACWDEWLAQNDMQNMKNLVPGSIQNGRQGCYMPSRYPPTSAEEGMYVLQYLQIACPPSEHSPDYPPRQLKKEHYSWPI